MTSELHKSIYEITGDNHGALVAITSANSTEVNSKLKHFDIRGEHVWCLYRHICKGDTAAFIKYISDMKERPSGIFECGHDWGASYSAPRTVCFAEGCENEGTKFCANCFSTRYCSRKCQRQSWSEVHKKTCNEYRDNVMSAICKYGVNEAARRLYISGILSEKGILRFIKKYN